MRLALEVIAGWRAAPDRPVNCPVCGAEGLQIVDRSARPYAEWYALTCPSCGLDATVHIPLSPPTPGG
jgi:transcription elongation factor Elf1